MQSAAPARCVTAPLVETLSLDWFTRQGHLAVLSCSARPDGSAWARGVAAGSSWHRYPRAPEFLGGAYGDGDVQEGAVGGPAGRLGRRCGQKLVDLRHDDGPLADG